MRPPDQLGLAAAVAAASARPPLALHVCRERDVGLFSLIQQVIANVPWALGEGRIPIADFRERTCYWTPAGRHGSDNVWEYYFEPVVADYPAASVPERITAAIEQRFPDQNETGYFVDDTHFVTNHFGDHPSLRGKALAIPYTTGNPDRALRLQASEIIRECVRPRPYIARKVDGFFAEHVGDAPAIGVHVRGTDAVSANETREYRRGSLDLARFEQELTRLLDQRPGAKVLVATDAEASLRFLKDAFGDRVVAYDAVRHAEGEAAGEGPTGCIMPAYVAADRETAAQNGEDAVVEYLLLARCEHLVHNGASLAATVLLNAPDIGHTNTHLRG